MATDLRKKPYVVADAVADATVQQSRHHSHSAIKMHICYLGVLRLCNNFSILDKILKFQLFLPYLGVN